MRISRSEYEKLLKCRKVCEDAEMKQGRRESEKHQQKDKARRKKEDEQINLAMEDSKKSYKELMKSEKKAEKEYARSVKIALRNSLAKEQAEDEGEDEDSCAQSSNQKWIEKIDDSPPAYCPHPIDRRLGAELNREMVSCRACVASLPFLFWPLTFYLFPFPSPTHPPKSPIRRRLVLSIHFLKSFHVAPSHFLKKQS